MQMLCSPEQQFQYPVLAGPLDLSLPSLAPECLLLTVTHLKMQLGSSLVYLSTSVDIAWVLSDVTLLTCHFPTL